ncbi:MAG TPA: hypothetical protein VMW44_00320 [Candidatus Bathyarchaeia archaeon]|nr:hypothetical protein [Candidatus Bathyarchaeia archaeon]
MNLAQEVEYGDEYLADKAICATYTCQKLAEIETIENEDADVPAEFRWRWQGRYGISGEICLDTPLTFTGYLPDPIFCASDSPFDELDGKMTDEEQIKKLIDYVREGSKIKFAHELAVRLNFLHEAVNEDPDEVPISIESLRNFISFLRNTTNLKYPNVVLTPSNEIRAQWRTAPNRHFAVVFLPTGEARFVIFSPNPKDPDKIDRLSGITSVDSLMETIRPHRVLEWASQ